MFLLDHLASVFTHPVNLAALAGFAALAAAERLRPARVLPRVPGWRAKGAAFLGLSIAISSSVPLLWDAYLAEHRLLDARGLGHVGGAFSGFLVYEVLLYAWHRALHRFDALWRLFHQTHHSAERVDVYGAYYFHPLDVVGFSLVTSLALVGVLGLTAEAALGASLAITFCNLFQHANVRTPRWLGFLVQRPESHGVHHQRGLHAHNFADLPLVDLVFGTFSNPERCDAPAGFYEGASRRMRDLLLARDVSGPAPLAPTKPRGSLSAAA